MKYWIIVLICSAAGLTVGYFGAGSEFMGKRELLLQSFYPDGVPDVVEEIIVSDDSPRAVVVNGETFDFGSMEKEESRTHKFIFKNDGNAPLTLHLGRKTCKCTSVTWEGDEIAPGDSVEVELEWKPESYARRFSQTATIKTNDPLRNEIELRIEGRVSQPLWSSPEALETQILATEGMDHTIYILSSEPDMEIHSAEFVERRGSEIFSTVVEPLPADAEILQTESARSGYSVRVIAPPGLPLEPVWQDLNILTSLSEIEELTVPVRGRVRGEISFSFRNAGSDIGFDDKFNLLTMGHVELNALKEADVSVFIRGDNAKDVRLWLEEDSISPNSVLSAEFVEERDLDGPKLMILQVAIHSTKGEPVNLQGPGLNNCGKIVIHSDHPIHKRIVLYVSFSSAG